MLTSEMEMVEQIARRIAKDEIAQAIAAHVHESNEKKALPAEPVAASVAEAVNKKRPLPKHDDL
jgi:hypothetical protein